MLPSLYHGNAQIFASRDVTDVQERLVATVRAVLDSADRAWYLATACRVSDRFGLYARDVFNRDTFRLRAVRAGLVLAEASHVRMTDEGHFACEGWPVFHPDFVVVNPRPGPGADNLNRGASLAFLFGILRLGDMTPLELRHISTLVKTAQIVAVDDPDELVKRIDRAGNT
jgi:hypothetical protein